MTTTVEAPLSCRGAYARGEARRLFMLGLALAAMGGLLLFDLTTGPSGMSLAEVWAGLCAGPWGVDRAAAAILWHIRMPQSLMAVLVGMCLGLGGQQMQTILNNPLASPFTLGFSAAAGFGAALAIMFGGLLPVPGVIVVPLSAFAATLVACAIVYGIARLRGAATEVLVLAGIAVLFFFQSLQSLLQFVASPEVLQQIVFWLFGSLLKADWTSVAVTALILTLCLPLVMRDAWNLTALRLGEANVTSLGLAVHALRRRSFIITALLTAAAVSFVGTIGFIGLIAPHASRHLAGEDHRYSLPLSAIIGAMILLAASVFGKLISHGAAIPVGIITAVAGVPILLAIILRRGAGQ